MLCEITLVLRMTSGQVTKKDWGVFGEYHDTYMDPLAIVFPQPFILSVCTIHVLQDGFYNFFCQITKVFTFVAAHGSMKIIWSASSNFAFHIQFFSEEGSGRREHIRKVT